MLHYNKVHVIPSMPSANINFNHLYSLGASKHPKSSGNHICRRLIYFNKLQ